MRLRSGGARSTRRRPAGAGICRGVEAQVEQGRLVLRPLGIEGDPFAEAAKGPEVVVPPGTGNPSKSVTRSEMGCSLRAMLA